MKFRPLLMLTISALVISLIAANPAAAQKYNANCDPPSEEAKVQYQAMIELNLRISALDRLVNNVCGMKQKLARLFSIEPDPDKIDNAMIFEVAKPDIDPVLARMQRVRESKALESMAKFRAEEAIRARRMSNPAAEAIRESLEREEIARIQNPGPLPWAASSERPIAPEPITFAPERKGGFISIFEGKREGETGLTGEGIIIQDVGIESGSFKNGELEGRGQEITPDGTWRGGTYQGGELEGEGFEVSEVGDRIAISEATFKDDKPDGVVEIAYDDGTSRKDIWYRGRRAAQGALADAGALADLPDYKTPEQIEEARLAQFENLLTSGSAEALYAQADQLFGKGDLVSGRRAFDAVVSRFPASPLAATSIARLSRQDSNDRADAQAAAERAEAARQVEAARQAQLAQLQYQQQLALQQQQAAQQQAQEAARQQQAAEAAQRRREENAAWGQLTGAIGQALGGGGEGGSPSTDSPPDDTRLTKYRCKRSSPEYAWTCW